MSDGRKPAIPRYAPVPSDLTEEDFRMIEQTVFVPADPKPSDVLFVFGYSRQDWEPVWNMYKEGMAPVIVATGLYGAQSPEKDLPQSHVIRDILIEYGVPATAIVFEDRSTNTLENVKFGKEALDARGISPKSILFFSKAHHSGRCMRTLRKYFPNAELSCFQFNPVYDEIVIARETWRDHRESRERVYGEYLRIREYSARGDIVA